MNAGRRCHGFGPLIASGEEAERYRNEREREREKER
jgi:hypothetical protein